MEAWDVSEVALQVARENAERNGVEVKVRRVDVLSTVNCQLSTVNYLIVWWNHVSDFVVEWLHMPRGIVGA